MNKKILYGFWLITLCCIVYSSCKKKIEIPPDTSLAAGQFYQGGIIVYIYKEGDTGYVAGEVHGLIASQTDLDTASEWGCYETAINAAANTVIGTGYRNTLAIVNACPTDHIAARLCNDLVLNGYDDWFLPSKMELNQLFLNRKKIGIFKTSARYWSSSQVDDKGAWQQLFSSPDLFKYGKAYPCRVRPVRAF